MVSQRGVTLIELMIAIALLAIVALAIFPLGRAWVVNQQITKTEKEFLEAYSRAKNEALRNPNAVKDGEIAATLKVDNTAKKIVVENSEEDEIWEVSFATTTTVKLTTGDDCDEDSPKVELNNNAYLIDGSCTLYKVEASGGTYNDAPRSL